ncbi:MAG: hypothetical protein V1792_26345 [Pseudomonadota bacterium]
MTRSRFPCSPCHKPAIRTNTNISRLTPTRKKLREGVLEMVEKTKAPKGERYAALAREA